MKTAIEMAIEEIDNINEGIKQIEEFDNTTIKAITTTMEMYKDKILKVLLPYEKKLLQEVFNESRLTHPMVGFKHDTFEEYLKTIKSKL